jgi:glycosyltransferase involved in cell wall biosynthesis
LIEYDYDLSVVIPAYNEEESICKVISELSILKKEIPSMEIIIVDDGSSDKTALRISNMPSVRLIKHHRNMGKGAALKTGFREARGQVVVIQDADMEYHPNELLKIVKPILLGNADVVYGTRLKRKPRGMSTIHYLGNIILSKVSSLLYWKNITDIMTGYKAFSSKVLKLVELKENGFAVEVELTAQLLQNNCRFIEVPIGYIYRSVGVSKIHISDGLKSLFRLAVCSLGVVNGYSNKARVSKHGSMVQREAPLIRSN